MGERPPIEVGFDALRSIVDRQLRSEPSEVNQESSA
jgi:hypothetical protein